MGTGQANFSRYDPALGKWEQIRLYGNNAYMDALQVMLGNDVISAGMSAARNGAVTKGSGSFRFRGKGGLYLHKSHVKDSFHFPLLIDGNAAHVDFLVKTSDRTAIAATKSGRCWRLTQPEILRQQEVAGETQAREMNAFVAAQTNRVAVKSVAASSTAPPSDGHTYDPTNLCDGNAGTAGGPPRTKRRGRGSSSSLNGPSDYHASGLSTAGCRTRSG